MDKTTKDILDALDFIKDRMATKADLGELRLEFRSELAEFRTELRQEMRDLRDELKLINGRIDNLEQHYGNLKGVTKEIDEVRARVRDIEKHLGINKKIAA